MNKKYIKLFVCLIILFVLTNTAMVFAISQDETYVWSQSLETSADEINKSKGDANNLKLESGAAILVDQNTGQILYEYNCHEKLRPASVTKIMTVLLIMEALDNGQISLDTKIPCSENAAAMGGSQIWLDVREELSVNDMLKAICVVSANDCTVAMAEYLAGSQESFVEKMNQKAKELGMNDTTFKNCHGIDEDGHVTSAYDISLMSRELLVKHPTVMNYTKIWMDSLRDGKSGLVNTNKLIRNYSGATGLKTGSTSLALYNLSASATRDGLSLIAVIMRAPTSKIRFSDAQKLLDYGFNNYSYKELAKAGEKVQSVSVEKGLDSSVELVYEENCGKLMKKGQGNKIEQSVEVNEHIIAPINQGDILGMVTFSENGNIIESVNLVANKDIVKVRTLEYCYTFIWNVV